MKSTITRNQRSAPIVEYRKTETPKSAAPVQPVQTAQPKQPEAKPEQAKDHSQQPKRSEAFWLPLHNQELVFQAKSGVIYTGTLTASRGQFVKVRDAEITGSNFRTKVSWLYIEKNSLVHFHSASARVERIERRNDEEERM